MSMLVSRKNKQKTSAIRTSCRHQERERMFARANVLPFFLLLVLMMLAGSATAATYVDPIQSASNIIIPPVERSYRVAQATGSISNWQTEAFEAIDTQKRLDKLAREQKAQNLRNQKLYKAAQRRKARTKPKVKKVSAKIRKKRRVASRNKDRNSGVVREPAKLQRCLQAAGYFNGVITGRLDDSTLLAYLAFREDKNLGHRPNSLYDPVIQKKLFALCPDDNLANLNQMIASAMGRKLASKTAGSEEEKIINYPIEAEPEVEWIDGPLTTASIGVAKKQARLLIVSKSKVPGKSPTAIKAQISTMPQTSTGPQTSIAPKSSDDENSAAKTFANDVLAATNGATEQLSTGKKSHKLASLETNGTTGGSSSFAVKRVVTPRVNREIPGMNTIVASKNVTSTKASRSKVTNTRVASISTSSSMPFAKSLSISDLAMVQPVSPNTCSPQKHAPKIAMSSLPPMSTARQAYPVRTASAYDTYMNDDGPLITGSISASTSLRKPIVKSIRRRVRLVQTAPQPKACLPRDLYDLLATAHGRKSEVSICKQDCLPAPRSFSPGQKELFAEQYDINWCGTGCLGIADPLPLDELMKIEREASVHVCMNPQLQLTSVAKKGTAFNNSLKDLYRALPGGYGNADNIAVLIGNKNYAKGVSPNLAAHVNVEAMKTLLIDQLGYSPENVLTLFDAKRSDMVRLLGKRGDVSGELQKRLKANPDAQLMVYYSGHASSSGLGLNNHLLPVDAVLGQEATSAYSMSVLYDNLRELDARTTQLFLETGFNADRSSVIQAPNIAERRVNVAPIMPVRGLAVFTAATGDQKPLIDHEMGIGLFTRYLISGLAGAADQRPIGNGDRIIDSVELYVHLTGNVRLAARKTLGLRQNPTFARSDNLFLSQLSRKPRN